jgi:hypothetical protein
MLMPALRVLFGDKLFMDETTTNQPPADILAGHTELDSNYAESDVFAWANNLLQYKDELKVEILFLNKNYVV